MEISILAVILAGLVGTLAMGTLMYAAKAFGVSRLDLGMLLGTFFLPFGRGALALGLALHFINGIIIAAIYAWILEATGWVNIPNLWSSLVIGMGIAVVHWLIVGLLMGVIGFIHPMIRNGELRDPGLFGKKYGRGEAVGGFVELLVYGGLVAWTYDWYRLWSPSFPNTVYSWSPNLLASGVAWVFWILFALVIFYVGVLLLDRFEPGTRTFESASHEPEPDELAREWSEEERTGEYTDKI